MKKKRHLLKSLILLATNYHFASFSKKKDRKTNDILNIRNQIIVFHRVKIAKQRIHYCLEPKSKRHP